jgi:hypothetical protein
MDYVGVAEEEGGEPVEIPVEEDGTGGHENRTHGGGNRWARMSDAGGRACQLIIAVCFKRMNSFLVPAMVACHDNMILCIYVQTVKDGYGSVTLMLIGSGTFTLKGIRIQLLTSMWIRIRILIRIPIRVLILIKVMGILDNWPIDPQD